MIKKLLEEITQLKDDYSRLDEIKRRYVRLLNKRNKEISSLKIKLEEQMPTLDIMKLEKEITSLKATIKQREKEMGWIHEGKKKERTKREDDEYAINECHKELNEQSEKISKLKVIKQNELNKAFGTGYTQGVEEKEAKFRKVLEEFGDAITGLLHDKPRGDIQFTWNDAIGKVMEMRNTHFGEYLKEKK